MKDLVVLVADKNMEYTLRKGLARHKSIGMRPISFDMVQHPERDGGVRSTGPDIVRLRRRSYSHALVVLDYEGSGTNDAAETLETSLDQRLFATWGTKAKAIVIEPELETWIWGTDNALGQIVRWPHKGRIREWIVGQGHELSADGKPQRPKEAFEEILQQCRTPRSSALYGVIADRLSIPRCTDPALQRLRKRLATWFPTG